MAEHFGFVGVGRMGAAMAGRLMDRGDRLTIFDVSEAAMAPLVARGAERASSPRAVADRAETIFASLPTPDIVREVALGADGIAAGTAARHFIDLSTTGPRVAAEVADGLAAKDKC